MKPLPVTPKRKTINNQYSRSDHTDRFLYMGIKKQFIQNAEKDFDTEF